MSMYSPSIEKLIQSFEKLPSIGNKTAARLAFYILNASEEETNDFVSSIVNAKKNLKYCSICYNISERSRFYAALFSGDHAELLLSSCLKTVQWHYSIYHDRGFYCVCDHFGSCYA